MDRPDLQGREAILNIHARKVKLDPQVELKTIAARTPGMVGADLANVVNEAALLAARRIAEAVEMRDFFSCWRNHLFISKSFNRINFRRPSPRNPAG